MSRLSGSVFIAAATLIAPTVLIATATADAGGVHQASIGQPRVVEVNTGNGYAVVLRFDRPVDHARSQLVLASKTGRWRITPRLSSEPDVLYAAVGRIPAGSYELEWTVPCPDGHVLSGKLPVEVADSAT